jgi:cysteine desulfurase
MSKLQSGVLMREKNEIYLDYAATTPVDPRVLQAMAPYFEREFGNPSSIHRYGQAAEAALETSRERVARNLNGRADEVLFTSCGTESDNLALRGVALARQHKLKANHILISPVEHHAVTHTAQQLAREFGFDLELLPVDGTGMVDPEAVKSRIRPETAIVSVIFANNEIGTINPVAEIGAVCRERGVPFHTDAVQAAAHLPIDVQAMNIDLLSLGAHKFYGPKGVGALFVRKGTDLLPMQTGGSQEYSRRAGTQNVPYIVGMAEAFDLAKREHNDRAGKVSPIREKIIGETLERIPDSRLTGHPDKRLPNHASFVFHGVDGNALLMLLDNRGFACSSGSACKTGDPEPSDVLLAIGLDREWALGSLRITLGKDSTPADAQALIAALPELVEQARRW